MNYKIFKKKSHVLNKNYHTTKTTTHSILLKIIISSIMLGVWFVCVVLHAHGADDGCVWY